jgi:hypothetical protein
MSDSEEMPPSPSDVRIGRVLREVLANGGDPPADELAVIATRSWMRQAKIDEQTAAPKELIKIPARDVVANPAGRTASSDRLKKWVVRAWVGAIAALVALAFVWIYFGMQPEDGPRLAQKPVEEPSEHSTTKPPQGSSSEKKPVPPKDRVATAGNDAPNRPLNETAPKAVGEMPRTSDPLKEKETWGPAEKKETVSTTQPAVPPVQSLPSVPPLPVELQPQTEIPGDEEITFVAGMDIVVSGRPIRPANLETFKLIEKETQRPVEMHWSTLEPSERKRVQKLYGMDISEGRLVYGERVMGTRFNLASGKSIVGLALPQYDFNGQRALKTCNAPLLMIHEYDIKSEEPVECFESYFYTPRELYDRWLAEKQPGQNDAAGHLDFARKAANLGLFQEALYHLKCAAVIDPRTVDTNADFRMEMIKRDADKQALELFDKMLLACASKDYFAASEYLGKLERNFPNSEHKSKWDARRAEIEAGGKLELKKQVIFLCYAVALDLLRDEIGRRVKIDAKGNLVPSIPGKLVTTTHGDIFRGTFVSDDESGLTILDNNTTLTIAHKDIMAIKDVDLSVGVREVPLSYDDVKEYVTDTRRPDGLKMQMLAAVAKRLKIQSKDAADLFESRTAVSAKYNGDHVIADPKFSSFHDAAYDKGSWLRDGAKPLPLLPDAAAPGVRLLQPRNSRGQNYSQPQKPVEDPELSDDPDIWWANQNADTKFNILRAFAAEKVFKAKDVVEQRCFTCCGAGTITVAGPGGRPITYRCPHCRGLKVLYKILYE